MHCFINLCTVMQFIHILWNASLILYWAKRENYLPLQKLWKDCAPAFGTRLFFDNQRQLRKIDGFQMQSLTNHRSYQLPKRSKKSQCAPNTGASLPNVSGGAHCYTCSFTLSHLSLSMLRLVYFFKIPPRHLEDTHCNVPYKFNNICDRSFFF